MKKVKITLQGALVVQHVAGATLECVTDEKGTLYVPALTGIASAGAVPSKGAPIDEEEEDDKPSKTVKKLDAPVATGKKFTSEELEGMDAISELLPLCKKLGIDVPEEGKNTNKKLRLLILANQVTGKPAADDDDAEEEEDTKPRKRGADSEKENPLTEKVKGIFTKLEDGDLNEAKTEAKLVELGASKKDAKKAVSDFMDNPDVKIGKFVAGILDIFEEVEEEEEEEEEDEKPAAKKAPVKTAAKKEKVVEEDELEVGDKVKVYWEDAEEHYTGEVKAIGKKGTLIAYDDDTEEYIDDNNTEIILL